MADSNIHHSMDLALILIDATSGKLANSTDVKLFEIRENIQTPVYPMAKDSSTYIFIDCERVSRYMVVEAKGFRRQKVFVDYEQMPQDRPIKEVYLIPEITSFTDGLYYEISGKKEGMTEITGINLKDILSHAERYDIKRNNLHTFEKATVLGAGGSPYGVMNAKDNTFEIFYADSSVGANAIKLRQPLSRELVRNSSIMKAVMGQVDEDGSYIFLVRKQNSDMKYLIRYNVNGEDFYQEIDFKNTEEEEWSLQ